MAVKHEHLESTGHFWKTTKTDVMCHKIRSMAQDYDLKQLYNVGNQQTVGGEVM